MAPFPQFDPAGWRGTPLSFQHAEARGGGEGFLQSLVRGEPPLLQGPFPVCRLICWSRHPRAGAEQAALSFGRLGGVVRADFPSQMLKNF